MSRSVILLSALTLVILFNACNNNKPKPVSKDLNKTTVLVNGKKDSVINNPQKNYGNATISDPCVKCLLQVVQADSAYKSTAGAIPAAQIKFIVNYIKTTQPQDTISEVKATNALRVDVINKKAAPVKLSSYIYDNSLSKLYLVTYKPQSGKTEVKTDARSLAKIRNSCYWGVASGK